MPYVEVGIALISANVEIVRWPQNQRASAIKRIAQRVNRMTPSVVRVELETTGESADHHQLQAIIAGSEIVAAIGPTGGAPACEPSVETAKKGGLKRMFSNRLFQILS